MLVKRIVHTHLPSTVYEQVFLVSSRARERSGSGKWSEAGPKIG